MPSPVTSSVNPIVNRVESEDQDLMTLAHMLVTYKISQLEVDYEAETEVLADRQKRLEFLNKMHRLLNSSDLVDDRGAIELKGEEYEKLLETAKELERQMSANREQADQLEATLENLEGDEKSTAEQTIKRLRQSADEIQDSLNASNILDDKKVKYSRDERDRLIDNVRTQDKLMKSQNSYQSQMIQKLQTERLEYINIGKDIMSKLHEAKKTIARAMRGS